MRAVILTQTSMCYALQYALLKPQLETWISASSAINLSRCDYWTVVLNSDLAKRIFDESTFDSNRMRPDTDRHPLFASAEKCLLAELSFNMLFNLQVSRHQSLPYFFFPQTAQLFSRRQSYHKIYSVHASTQNHLGQYFHSCHLHRFILPTSAVLINAAG